MANQGTTPPWPTISRAYQLWAELGDIDRNPSPEEAKPIRQALIEEGYITTNFAVNGVTAWFENRTRFSPIVDPVAVERAARFEWPVIRNLTLLEKQALAERLARIDNWKDAPTDANGVAFAAPGGDTESTARFTNRYLRWREGSQGERNTIDRAVHRAKNSLV